MWVPGAALTATMVRPKVVCREMGNPGSTEVKQFLALLGIDMAAFMDQVGAVADLDSVNGLVARRNQIAHGDVGSTASYADVDGYLQNVESLAAHADQAVARAIQSICHLSALPW